MILTDYSTRSIFVKEFEDAEWLTAVQSSAFRVHSAVLLLQAAVDNDSNTLSRLLRGGARITN